MFVLFPPVHTITFSFDLMCFSLSSTLKRLKTLIEAAVYDTFSSPFSKLSVSIDPMHSTFEAVFGNLRFHQRFVVMPQNAKPTFPNFFGLKERFRKTPFSQRISVKDRPKRSKGALSNFSSVV